MSKPPSGTLARTAYSARLMRERAEEYERGASLLLERINDEKRKARCGGERAAYLGARVVGKSLLGRMAALGLGESLLDLDQYTATSELILKAWVDEVAWVASTICVHVDDTCPILSIADSRDWIQFRLGKTELFNKTPLCPKCVLAALSDKGARPTIRLQAKRPSSRSQTIARIAERALLPVYLDTPKRLFHLGETCCGRPEDATKREGCKAADAAGDLTVCPPCYDWAWYVNFVDRLGQFMAWFELEPSVQLCRFTTSSTTAF